jgi:Uma2 family endonuclease
MSTIVATPISQIDLAPGSAICINGVTWPNYLKLLDELGDSRYSRVAYDNGTLEIRMPGQAHEAINRVLATIVMVLAEELGLDLNDLGSMTMNRSSLLKGIEPDSCFYIQNAQAGQGLGQVIPEDLPPDLVIEVDIANRSDSKLSLYQAMQVPEVWLYQREQLSIKHLVAGEYRDSDISLAFSPIQAECLNQWLDLRHNGTDLSVVRAVREFCRTRFSNA